MTDTPDGESVPLSEWERYQHSEELKSLTAENAKLKKALLAAEKQSTFAYSVSDQQTRVPKWLAKKPPSTTRHAVAACLMISDLHFPRGCGVGVGWRRQRVQP